MPLRFIEHPEVDVFELIVDGDRSAKDLDAFIARFDRFAEGRSPCMLEIVERPGAVERGTGLKAMRYRVKNAFRIRRLAVVVDSSALRTLLRVVDLITPMQIRTYARSAEDDARRWVSRGA